MLRMAVVSMLLSQKCIACQAQTMGVHFLQGLTQLHLYDLICNPYTASACQFYFIPSALKKYVSN